MRLAAPTERLGSGGAARQHLLSQLMTYRSLFVVASGQNACAACLLLSRRNNRRKDDHGELRQVGPTCNKVGWGGGGALEGRRGEGGAWEDNKPSRRMGRRGPRVARDGGGMMMAVGQRDPPLLASADPAPLPATGTCGATRLVLSSLDRARQI